MTKDEDLARAGMSRNVQYVKGNMNVEVDAKVDVDGHYDFAGNVILAKGDFSYQIKQVIEETTHCEACGLGTLKKETFKCKRCDRIYCLNHLSDQLGTCTSCTEIDTIGGEVRASFTNNAMRTIEFDRTSLDDMSRTAQVSMKACLAIPDDFGIENIQPLDHSMMRKYYRIGRDTTNDIIIPDGKASRNHAHIYPTRSGYFIRDSCSLNGIRINGKKVSEARLGDGDIIHIGPDQRLFFSEEYESLVYLNGRFKGMIAVLPDIRIKKDFQIGRCHTSEIKMGEKDSRISRHHARIVYNNGSYYLEDIGSMHGTRLNGRSIGGLTLLRDADIIRMGRTEVVFHQ